MGKNLEKGTNVFISIRAERVELNQSKTAENTFNGTLSKTIYKGKYSDHHIDAQFGEVRSRVWDKNVFEKDTITVLFSELATHSQAINLIQNTFYPFLCKNFSFNCTCSLFLMSCNLLLNEPKF